MRADVTGPALDLAQLQADAACHLMAGMATRCCHVVMSPGSRSTPLVLAARASKDVTVDVVLDERAAGFYALGIARSTRRPVALLCTSGSAGLHYLPAVAEARADGVPLIVLTADRPPELHGCEAPQTMDQSRMFGVHAKRSVDLDAPRPRAWLRAGVQAAAVAASGRPGPVHLNVAFRKPLWRPDVRYTVPTGIPNKLIDRSVLDAREVRQLAADVPWDAKGVIFCGAGPTSEGVAAAARKLSDATGWPLLAAAASGVRFDAEGSGGSITAYEAIVRSGRMPPPAATIEIGRPPLSRQVLEWIQQARTRIVVSNTEDTRTGRPGAVHIVRADVVDTLSRLAAAVPESGSSQRDAWSAADAACAAVAEQCSNEQWEGPVAAAVCASVDDGSTLLVAASMPIRDMNQFGRRAIGRVRILANRGLNGIDGLIACAAGVARAQGRATLLIGDLAFRHDIGGLLAATEACAQIDVVVVNNEGGGIFGFLPIAAHSDAFEPAFVARQSSSIRSLAQAAGAQWWLCDSPDAVREVLTTTANGIRVIEIRTDRDINLAAHKRYLERCKDAIAHADLSGWAA